MKFLQRIFGFHLVGLTCLLMIFFIASSITSSLKTNNSYNTSPEQEWILVGGITSFSATFRVRTTTNGSNENVLVVSRLQNLSNPIFEQQIVTDDMDNEFVQTLNVPNLEPNTKYYYGLINPNDDITTREGSFSTPGVEGQRFNFSIAAAGCAWTGSKSKVFSTIANQEPLLFFHLGDFHYEDISENDLELRIDAIDKVMGSSNQMELFSSVGLVYMWDDHDWLGDESTSEGEGREAGLQSYRVAFPFYAPLPATENAQDGEEVPPYHAFTIGTIRFIVMDLRSEATLTNIYSQEQKSWLLAELANASLYDFIILVSTKPWIGVGLEPGGDDSWHAYVEDRAELSNFISTIIGQDNGPQNLLMISADAHMIAFDDGSNTYYGPEDTSNASTAPLSFPILQTGPMDRLGSTRGGPFTQDCHAVRYERNHHFSVINFVMPSQDDDEACIKITTHDEDKSEIISVQELCGHIFSSSANVGDGTCDIPLLSTESYAMFGVLVGFWVLMSITAGWFLNWRNGLSVFGLDMVIGFCTLAVGLGIPTTRDIPQFETFTIIMIGMIQMSCGFLFVVGWIVVDRRSKEKEEPEI